MKIGRLLKIWRAVEDKTTQEAADEIGIAKATFNRLEAGKDVNGTTLSKLINWMLA